MVTMKGSLANEFSSQIEIPARANYFEWQEVCYRGPAVDRSPDEYDLRDC